MEMPFSSRMPQWLARIGCPDARVSAYLLLYVVDVAVLAVSYLAGLDSGVVLGWMIAASVLAAGAVSRLFGDDPGTAGVALPVGR